jgi:hypothetical protein
MTDVQKLCTGYGYRPISKHDALVDLAIQCWRAMHPLPAGNKVRSRSMAPTRSSSISSADMPLSKIRNPKSKSKVVQTGKQKRIASTGVSVESGPIASSAKGLNDRFLGMIRGDSALWLRILRYEVSCFERSVGSADIFQPISFDELISKVIASGIDEKGWRIKLKRFLDLQVNLHSTPEISSKPPADPGISLI